MRLISLYDKQKTWLEQIYYREVIDDLLVAWGREQSIGRGKIKNR